MCARHLWWDCTDDDEDEKRDTHSSEAGAVRVKHGGIVVCAP